MLKQIHRGGVAESVWKKACNLTATIHWFFTTSKLPEISNLLLKLIHLRLNLHGAKMNAKAKIYAINHWNYYRPQQSCEGYVFTHVCDSFHGGGVLSQHALQQGGLLPGGCLLPGGLLLWGCACSGGVPATGGCLLWGSPHPSLPESRRLLLQTVRILLECILVSLMAMSVLRFLSLNVN